MYIKQLYTNCLAEAAYYIESAGEAAVIDPIRDTVQYIQLAQKQNAKIKYIFETHFHADFVSGHIDLARATGATIVYGPQADPAYKVYHAKDNEKFSLGHFVLQALHTPGHTLESTCYLLWNKQGKAHAVFTGDTLFVGDVGRPDLLGGTMTKETLAGMLYDSLTNKLKPLPDYVWVYPAHGPGSSCGKNLGTETFSTMGVQKQTNYALQKMSKASFVKKVTQGIAPPPQYFFQDVMINKKGYKRLSQVMAKSNKALSLANFNQAVQQGAQILDTRAAEAFEKKFIPGALNVGLNGQYAIWVGTLLAIHTPLVLVTEPGKEEESVRRLARIGYENVIGYLQGSLATWQDAGNEMHTISSINAQDMALWIRKGFDVLDVRKIGEYALGHVKGALHYTLSTLTKHLPFLAKEKNYLVYCGSGYRSMIAASLLKAQGYPCFKNVCEGFRAIQMVADVPIVAHASMPASTAAV